MKRIVITTILVFAFITLGTVFAVIYARGYRFTLGNGRNFIAGTGLVVFSSKPDGARVSINGHLTTATNNTLNLAPGEYDVLIQKDGYFDWKKKIIVKKEVVAEANATLFPVAPKLESVTITGSVNPTIDTTGTLIAYTTISSVPTKSGIYILDMNAKPILSLGGLTNQIIDNSTDNFPAAILTFSPDGTQLLASISAGVTSDAGITSYLLNPKSSNPNPRDVTATLPQVEQEWNKQKAELDKKTIAGLPRELRAIAAQYFSHMLIAPEEARVLYTASTSGTLPVIKKPRLIAVDSAPEERTIKQGNVYVYDVKEDRNYLLFDTEKTKGIAPYVVWSPDSRHLIFIKDKAVHIVEFDGLNDTVVYAGPFDDRYVFPWPDGSSIVILTNLNIPGVPNNLYKISLK